MGRSASQERLSRHVRSIAENEWFGSGVDFFEWVRDPSRAHRASSCLTSRSIGVRPKRKRYCFERKKETTSARAGCATATRSSRSTARAPAPERGSRAAARRSPSCHSKKSLPLPLLLCLVSLRPGEPANRVTVAAGVRGAGARSSGRSRRGRSAARQGSFCSTPSAHSGLTSRRSSKRIPRLVRIAEEATKQCDRTIVPFVEGPKSTEEFLRGLERGEADRRGPSGCAYRLGRARGPLSFARELASLRQHARASRGSRAAPRRGRPRRSP